MEIEKKTRGRPKKLEILNPEFIEPIKEVPKIPKMPRERPKIFQMTKEEYNAIYYKKNKEKTKGTCLCDVCNVLVSKSNKSRHIASKYHQNMINFHINEVHEVLNQIEDNDEGETDTED